MLTRYKRFITQPKRPLTKINRMCSDKSLVGDPAGIRTPDPLLKRQLLCRLSYRIIYLKRLREKSGWDGWTRTSG